MKTLTVILLMMVSQTIWAAGGLSPEKVQNVILSSRDVNRIVCEGGDIEDLFFSEEKGVIAKTSGSNAFIKITSIQEGNKIILARQDIDLFVICGGMVYSIIGQLRPVPSQTIYLSGRAQKIRKTYKRFRKMPFEKRVLAILRKAYLDNYPETFDVKEENKILGELGGGIVELTRTIDVAGAGLRIRELSYYAADSDSKLHEKDFLKPQFGSRIVAISIDKPSLVSGESTRVFMIEKRY